jgi:hypothetical protein
VAVLPDSAYGAERVAAVAIEIDVAAHKVAGHDRAAVASSGDALAAVDAGAADGLGPAIRAGGGELENEDIVIAAVAGQGLVSCVGVEVDCFAELARHVRAPVGRDGDVVGLVLAEVAGTAGLLSPVEAAIPVQSRHEDVAPAAGCGCEAEVAIGADEVARDVNGVAVGRNGDGGWFIPVGAAQPDGPREVAVGRVLCNKAVVVAERRQGDGVGRGAGGGTESGCVHEDAGHVDIARGIGGHGVGAVRERRAGFNGPAEAGKQLSGLQKLEFQGLAKWSRRDGKTRPSGRAKGELERDRRRRDLWLRLDMGWAFRGVRISDL